MRRDQNMNMVTKASNLGKTSFSGILIKMVIKVFNAA